MPPPTQSPPFTIPSSPPVQWTPATVIPYVKIGMMVELSTIPLYLYAMYSVKPEGGAVGAGARTRALLRGIVQQEMLHLSLAGNLLSALNGSMDLYAFGVVPRYPGEILVEKIPLNLDRANKENLQCFLQIEASDTPPMTLPTHKSIGQFYNELQQGLNRLPDSAFAHNADKQFSGMDFFDDQMTVITGKASALKALTTIVEQGEGDVAVPDSHYTVFAQLYSDREAWVHYEVPKNPKTSDYKGRSTNDFVYKLSLAFDAGYCYMFQTIQRVWKTGRRADEIMLRMLLLRNVHVIMTHVLTPIANILVQQPLTNPTNGLVAAPCFNYFPLNDNGTPRDPLAPAELHRVLVAAVSSARDASPSDQVRASLEHMRKYIDTKIKPST
ncbi:hypothetical protein BS47DRAFT_1490060 [Hydnum rufescens UP504]|uniref:Iminophenyl-pyruvate dimer synthase domain-containing protein n=1 Tax=Hydnum rufescens UP504 TaxID=1448309 RepID=A0A9P6AH05_9AGAM|nr:hypothetical protein BS47DRAFT_1490060 [Hydnum rufescens UP504]